MLSTPGFLREPLFTWRGMPPAVPSGPPLTGQRGPARYAWRRGAGTGRRMTVMNGDPSEEPTAVSPAGGGAQPASLAPGTKVAHFEVLGLLGRGGFGEVYRARDAHLGRMVALKVLRPEVATNDLRE